jgi:hypothetical protein
LIDKSEIHPVRQDVGDNEELPQMEVAEKELKEMEE